MDKSVVKREIVFEGGIFRTRSIPRVEPPTYAFLPPGYYVAGIDDGLFGEIVTFAPKKDTVADTAVIRTKEQQMVMDYIAQFFSPDTKKRYEEIGLVWKTGMLLHGLPGTGKTYSVMAIVDFLIKNGCAVLYEPPIGLLTKLIDCARCGNNDLPIVAIYEDCESNFHRNQYALMQLLDGQESVNGFVIIGTTNDIDRIPERIWMRPSRFSKIIEFNYADQETIAAYLSNKLGSVVSKEEIDKIAQICSGYDLVLDEIKHVACSAYALQRDVKEVLEERYFCYSNGERQSDEQLEQSIVETQQ